MDGSCDKESVYYNAFGPEEAVNSLDYANRFSPSHVALLTQSLLQKYPPAAVYRAAWVSEAPSYMMYPREPTPCMYGHRSGVKGIVINSLYDGATPYVNAKRMRGGLSDSVLVTWQGIGHTVTAADYDPEGVKACLAQVDEYWKSGNGDPSNPKITLPIDGFTCRNSREIVKAEADARKEHTRRKLAAGRDEL